MSVINNRIKAVRAKMGDLQLDAIVIPSTDPHQSEYVCDHWKVRAYFSGFTGSAGTMVITKDTAVIWTDSRYFLQVEDECASSEVQLMKQKVPHAPEHIPWLCTQLSENAVIGIDYQQFSLAQVAYIEACAKPVQIGLQNIPSLWNDLWEDRPELPSAPVEIHPLEYSGESTTSKLKKVKEALQNAGADYYFISGLDDIAWLFNIRSNDVDFTPLVTAYAYVGQDNTFVYCDPERFQEDTIKVFKALNIVLKSYRDFVADLPELSSGKTVITDKDTLNYACYSALKAELIYKPSLPTQLKKFKNDLEIENAGKCMVKDGVALTRFFIWLEQELENKELSEYEIGRVLESFRKEQPLYKGESFAAIVGYKGNGAIIHYTAPEEGSAMVRKEGILLIDSGAQYENGTTDITRTVWLGGTPTEEIKTAYTGVLKGYITLDQMRFPKGTVGMQLDVVARMHLWNKGLNYPHGTGHGIGNYGMVHEPDQGFAASMTTTRGWMPHEPNQFTTIEPGCYKAGTYGIRTENVVVSKAVATTAFGEFYGFEALTLFPIDKTLIQVAELTASEREWLNVYHKKVYDKLAPKLKPSERDWLRNMCEPI